MTLTRRELLRLLGTSAAAGALLATGCGGAAPALTTPELDGESLRAALRDAVAQVRERFAGASGWAAVRERTTLIAGTGPRGTARRRSAIIVLRARDRNGRTLERAIGDATPAAIAALAAELAALGPGGGRSLDAGRAADHLARVERDPGRVPIATWLEQLDATLRRAEALGSSRIVWRAAHAVVEDDRRWFVGDGRDVAQRAVRVRSGLTLMAWSGTRPMIGEVITARAAGIEALALDDAAVARAAERALELLTPGDAPAGDAAVVLDASVTAALIGAGVGEVLTAAAWARPDLRARALLGTPIAAGLTVVDDPTGGGFAGYHVDDEGRAAARTVLVDDGRLAAVLADERGAAVAGLAATGHGRRSHRGGAVAARASDLTLRGGTVDDAGLLAAIDDGLLIEDADGASVELASWQLVVRARRARRVTRGKLSGHAWTDVEVRGDLPGLLGATVAIGAGGATHATGDAEAPATSVTAPALATRAMVQPRRRV